MRTRLLLASLVALAGVALCATPAFASTPLPQPSGYVNDFAHVLMAETVSSLNAELTGFEASTSNEIAVATVDSMNGDYIEHYAPALFQLWGIGKKNRDNGVLILLAIAEHKIRIEVGYGLEGALPDSVAQSIIDNDMTPRLKAGDYDGAVTAAVVDVEAATQGEYQAEATSSGLDPTSIFWLIMLPIFFLQWLAAILGRSKSWFAGGGIGALLGISIWFLLPLAALFGGLLTAALFALGLGFDYLVSNAYSTSKTLGTRPPWWAGGSGGGSSSGGGFGGFGGGSSGGGGASGGW